MNLINKIKIILKQPIIQYYRIFYKKPIVMNCFQTIDYIILNKCGVSRFGDGEIDLMEMIDIKYQKASKKLKNKLEEVARADSDSLLVCIPNIFIDKKNMMNTLSKENVLFWKKHEFFLGGIYRKYFFHLCGDSLFTRFYYETLNKIDHQEYIARLRKIWNKRNIVFVEGKKSKNGIGNDLYSNAKSIKRIICPSENAFEKYDEILNCVVDNCRSDDLIICTLGPTATILCYDLSIKYNLIALDLGHIDLEYEWFLSKSTIKIAVPGKDASETSCDYVETNNYEKETIIGVIK